MLRPHRYLGQATQELCGQIINDQSYGEPFVSFANLASWVVCWSRRSVSAEMRMTIIPRGCLKLAVGQVAGFQLCDLLRRERRVEDLGRVGVAAKHVGDEVNAIGKIGPLDLAGITRAVRRGIDLREQSNQIGVSDLPQCRWKLGTKVITQVQAHALRQAAGHQLIGDTEVRLTMCCRDRRLDRVVKRNGSMKQWSAPPVWMPTWQSCTSWRAGQCAVR